MKHLKLIGQYVQWRLKARNRHGIHSPFVYSLLDQCVYASSTADIFNFPELQRKTLKKNHRILKYNDPGAGSRFTAGLKNPEIEVKVRTLASHSLQPVKFCRLYYRMAKYLGCQNILELGTSLGITTSYLSLANPNAQIDTIEGAEPVAAIAKEYFTKYDMDNIRVHHGSFGQVLPGLIKNKKYDFVFIDGDHQGEKLLTYFSMLKKHIHPNGVLIVDDIRWSDSMWQAWQQICKDHDVKVTLDLFFTGIVFFSPALSKEDFAIQF